MIQEERIILKALQLEQVALKRRVAMDETEEGCVYTPYLDKKGAFKLQYLAKLAVLYIDWINACDEHVRVVTTSDGVQMILDDLLIPETLKSFIWPKSVKLDPTSYYMINLIDRDTYPERVSISSQEIEFLLRGWNAYLYGDASDSLHTVTVGSLRTDVALMNYIDHIKVASKSSNGDLEEFYCKSSAHGRLCVVVDGLEHLMQVEGYFDLPDKSNYDLLEKYFRFEL